MAAPVDDIWESMKLAEKSKISEYKKRMEKLPMGETIEALIKSDEKSKAKSRKVKVAEEQIPMISPPIKSKEKAKEKSMKPKAKTEDSDSVAHASSEPALVTLQDARNSISRDIEGLNSDNVVARRNALMKIHNYLFREIKLSSTDYSDLFRDHCKAILKLFADSVEKCREYSVLIVQEFIERATDLVPVLGYLLPCVMQRIPSGLAYDEEMKVFVSDIEAHEAYRRGRAVDRQDKGGAAGLLSHTVIENSEEIRLLLAAMMFKLVQRVASLDAVTILHPYFHEIILFFQHQLSDPYPELKIVACNALELLCSIPDFEGGMKFFAVGLVRSILPVLRHRHAKARIAGIAALRCCMMVPDRAKCKGAGTEAITDLVGFREDNVLQVSAFYKVDVQINYLAELVGDKSVAVREDVVRMLTAFLTELGDRYDHQTRLVPYLLDLLTDEATSVSSLAMACVKLCGRQYEDEHHDEIIEKRQYGVDGDMRINIDKPLPPPFTERPRIGVRLYIRGSTKRFLSALVGELTNWQAQTRMKSVELLKVVVISCEEHLTMEAFTLIPAYIKALHYAKDDSDKLLQIKLYELFELVGRFMLPDTYVHFILPRLKGDPEIVQFGVDVTTRESVLEFLRYLISGSRFSQILPHFESIIDAVCDPFVIDPDSVRLKVATLDLLTEMLSGSKGKGKAMVEAHFMNTGRLSSLKTTIKKLLRFLLSMLGDKSLIEKVSVCLSALAGLEADTVLGAEQALAQLFSNHSADLLDGVIENYEVDESWDPNYIEHRILTSLVHSPWPCYYDSPKLLREIIGLLINLVNTTASQPGIFVGRQIDAHLSAAKLLYHILRPIADPTAVVELPHEYHHVVKEIVTMEKTQFVIADGSIHHHVGIGVIGFKLLSTRSTIVEGHDSVVHQIAKSFLIDQVWSHYPKLLDVRLRLLAIIGAGAHFVDGEMTVDFIAHGPLDSVDRIPLLFQIEKLPVIQVIGSYANASLALNAVTTVVASSIQSCHSAHIRTLAVRILLAVVTLFDQCTVGGIVRVQSFAAIASASGVAPRNPPEVLAAARRDFVAIEHIFRMAVELLNDSCDDVREIALEILNAAILARFVRNDQAIDELADLIIIGSVKLPTALAHSPISWSAVSKRLISEIPVALQQSSEMFTDALDRTLRNIASLDPRSFETLIREQLSSLIASEANLSGSGGTALEKVSCSEFVSGLVDHCQILAQFQ